MACPIGVYPIEVVMVQAFREACGMYNVIKSVGGKLLFECFLRREIKRYKVNTRIGEIGF